MEPLSIVLLWALLIAVLAWAAYKASKKGKKTEARILLLVIAGWVILTGNWIVLILWVTACTIGIPIDCVK